ncbi:MAG: PAS domain-containing protein [Pseudomonadota bacterium]
MRNHNSKRLFKYWNSLRGLRSAPDRREIEPSDIREILGDTFILELDHNYRNLSFRLAGTRLCNAHGRELKGVGFLSLWDETDNMQVYKCVSRVFQHSEPCVIFYTAESEQGKTAKYEMLLLPLLNGTESASRILGISTPLESLIWLGSDPLSNCILKSGRYIKPEHETAEQAPPLVPEIAATDTSNRKVRHLTIIDGGMD